MFNKTVVCVNSLNSIKGELTKLLKKTENGTGCAKFSTTITKAYIMAVLWGHLPLTKSISLIVYFFVHVRQIVDTPKIMRKWSKKEFT